MKISIDILVAEGSDWSIADVVKTEAAKEIDKAIKQQEQVIEWEQKRLVKMMNISIKLANAGYHMPDSRESISTELWEKGSDKDNNQ